MQKKESEVVRERTEDAQCRKVWSLKHRQDMYGIDEDDLRCNVDVAAKGHKKKRKGHQSVKLSVQASTTTRTVPRGQVEVPLPQVTHPLMSNLIPSTSQTKN